MGLVGLEDLDRIARRVVNERLLAAWSLRPNVRSEWRRRHVRKDQASREACDSNSMPPMYLNMWL